jgi:hypothetical protein
MIHSSEIFTSLIPYLIIKFSSSSLVSFCVQCTQYKVNLIQLKFSFSSIKL